MTDLSNLTDEQLDALDAHVSAKAPTQDLSHLTDDQLDALDSHVQRNAAPKEDHDFMPALKSAGRGVVGAVKTLATKPLTDIVYDNVVQPGVDEYQKQRAAGTGVINSGLAGLAKSSGVVGDTAGNMAAPATTPLRTYLDSRARGNSVEDATKDARNSAVILAGGGLAGSAAASGIGKLPAFAENRGAAALGWTKAARSKFGNDAARQAGRVGLDESIVTPLASTESKLEGMRGLHQSSGQAIGDTMTNLDEAGHPGLSPVDTAAELKAQLGPMGEQYKSNRITSDLGKQYDNMMADIADKGESPMTFADSQRYKKALGDVAYPKGSASEGTEQLQRGYGIVNDQLDKAVDRGAAATGDADLLAKLKKARSNYQASDRSIKTLNNMDASEQGNKLFGLTDHVVAAAAHNPLEIAAKLGLKSTAERYGNNVLATGADKLSALPKDAIQAALQRLRMKNQGDQNQ